MGRVDFARSAVSVPNITLRLSKTPAGQPPAPSSFVGKAGEYPYELIRDLLLKDLIVKAAE